MGGVTGGGVQRPPSWRAQHRHPFELSDSTPREPHSLAQASNDAGSVQHPATATARRAVSPNATREARREEAQVNTASPRTATGRWRTFGACIRRKARGTRGQRRPRTLPRTTRADRLPVRRLRPQLARAFPDMRIDHRASRRRRPPCALRATSSGKRLARTHRIRSSFVYFRNLEPAGRIELPTYGLRNRCCVRRDAALLAVRSRFQNR